MRLLLGKWATERDRLLSAFYQRVTADGGTIQPSLSCLEFPNEDVNADFLFLAGATKSGKMYNVIPESGANDPTFSRASTATRINSAGIVESVASGMPRIDYYGSSCPGYLSEGQRTNFMLHANDFANAAWTKDGTTASSGANSPLGTSTARVLTEAATNAVHTLFQSNAFFSVALGQTWTQSVWVKKGTGSSAPNIIQITWRAAGFGTGAWANFNLSTGLFTRVEGGTARVYPFADGWYRISFTATATAGAAVNVGVILAFCNNNPNATRIPTYAGNVNANVQIAGYQVSIGLMATAYIPTAASIETRVADSAAVALPYTSQSGCIYGEVNVEELIGTLGRHFVNLGTVGVNEIFVGFTGIASNTVRFTITAASVTQVDFRITRTDTSLIKFAIRYQSGNSVLFVNGVRATQITNNAYTFGTIPTSGFIGRNLAGGSELNGRVYKIAMTQNLLSDWQLQELTL